MKNSHNNFKGRFQTVQIFYSLNHSKAKTECDIDMKTKIG